MTIKPNAAKGNSLFSALFYLVFHMLLLVMAAWFLDLIIASILVFTMGWNFAYLLFQKSLISTSASLPIHLFNQDAIQVATQTAEHGNAWYPFSMAADKVNYAVGIVSKYLALITLVTNLIVLRAIYFVQGSAVLLFGVGLGLMEGLIQRDIRKYQGARESTLFFHRSKQLLNIAFLSGFFLFISLPIPFKPSLVLLLLAIILGYLTMLATRSFKKYL